eukprot:GFUD01034665.1.p2 GENE.GFUD01034665.1~~GFUD01034665.1.p2  ORF type:complete len:103 (-),score=30.37 GFUD01034665.1:175-483(-)
MPQKHLGCDSSTESSPVIYSRGDEPRNNTGQQMRNHVFADDVTLVPVHKDDFKKINEFAEAAWVCRDPDNSDNIKERRRNLLREHNAQVIKILEEREEKNKN